MTRRALRGPSWCCGVRRRTEGKTIMVKLGYKLMSEEHGPTELVRNAKRAEQAGFEFAAISDHFFPWLEEQGHAPLAWSVLGALANATQRMGLMTAVTCPTMRYHPAIVAQGAATLGLLSDDRFTLGLGAGERLNEHVVGAGWPGRGEREEEAKRTAHRYFRWSVTGWPVMAELPDTEGFAAASKHVSPETVAQSVSCGPSADRHLKAIDRFVTAGYDHIILVQVGPQQDAFIDFFARELASALRNRKAA